MFYFLFVDPMRFLNTSSRRFTAATFVAAIMSPAALSDSLAGAFNLDPGQAQAIISITTTRAKDYLLNDGSLAPVNFHKIETSLLLEYGIIPQFTAIIRPSDLMASSIEPNNSKSKFNSLGPTSIGGRMAIAWWGTSALSTEVTVHLPSKAMLLDSWLIGQLRPEPEVRLLYGSSAEVYGHGTYFDIQAAYRERFGVNASEWHLDLTHATHLTPNVTILNQQFLTRSIGGRHGIQLNYEQRKIQTSIVYDVGALSFQLGLFKTTSGRNAYDENGSLMAMWLRF